MKKINKYFLTITALIASFSMLVSCDNDFENPNSTTSKTILTTREGLFSLSIGIRQLYSTTTLRFIVETPATTTREVANTSTFLNLIELEDGGNIPNFNSNTQGLWVNLTRVMGMTESLYEGASITELEPGTVSGLKAYANLFQAMSIGHLAINYEQVVIKTSKDNNATFVPRQEGLLEAIRLLEEAKALITATPISTEFSTSVLRSKINLGNTINLMLARFYLYAGNYNSAITNANLVSKTAISVFTYDSLNSNPIWDRGVRGGDSNFFRAQDNFGLPTSIFTFDPNDGRLSFYLIPYNGVNPNGFAVESLKGFFTNQSTPIPIYIPDEATLILAEANLRIASPNITAAVAALNEVLTDTDDPFGINANVAPYAGAMDVNSILLEIYKNRRAELFLSGNCLEDSRRFNRPQPSPTPRTFTDERNRNFYPYASTERNNNPNTPADPAL